MTNAELVVRPGTVDDFDQCRALDHHYRTTRVWQLNWRETDLVQTIRFQTVRLPRPLTVPYPHPIEKLADRWCQAHAFIVAEEDSHVIGYLTLMADPVDPLIWLNDLVVTGRRRRQGLGGRLLAAAMQWARRHGYGRLMAKVPTKNDPAIRFLKKNGLTFCGYNEYQFHKEEIVLYLSVRL